MPAEEARPDHQPPQPDFPEIVVWGPWPWRLGQWIITVRHGNRLGASHGIVHADLIDLYAGVPTVDAVQMCSYLAICVDARPSGL